MKFMTKMTLGIYIYKNKGTRVHVGIITYQVGHLKTYQLMTKLILKGHKITLYAFPFEFRQITRPIFEDRPFQITNIDMYSYCKVMGANYKIVHGWERENVEMIVGENSPDIYMTCIGKIIPSYFLKDRIILNAHPGVLPICRGLDAFKWAIINAMPIGVTLHVINEDIDGGKILKVVYVPIFESDTLENVCQRAYEIECDLMTFFDTYLNNINNTKTIDNTYPISKKGYR